MLFFLIHKWVLLYFFLKYKEFMEQSRVRLCGIWKKKIGGAVNLHELPAERVKTVPNQVRNRVEEEMF